MALRRPGGAFGDRRVHAVALDQQGRDVGGGRKPQRHRPAAGADGHQDVGGGGRAEHPDGAGGGLLDGLEQHVRGPLGHPVRVLHHDDPPAARRRPVAGGGHQVARLIDGDGDLFRAHERHVGMGFAEDGQAGRAFAAAAQADVFLVAVQRGGEGLRGVGPAGTGRAGEKPRMRQPFALGRLAQLGHDGGLALEVVPDGHAVLLCGRAAWATASRDSTRSRIRAASSATGRWAGNTRYASGRAAARSRKAARIVAWNSSASDSRRSSAASPAVRRLPADCGLDVEQHREVRLQARRRPVVDVPDRLRPEAAAGALVSDRGVNVPVGQDDLAALQCGPDDLGWRARRGTPRKSGPPCGRRCGRGRGPGRANAASRRSECRPVPGSAAP